MSDGITSASMQHAPELLGQTLICIGGSAGIGLETARRARAEGADVVLTSRNSDRLKRAAAEVDAQRTAAFDATDSGALHDFFEGLSGPIDHVLVTAGGPRYGPLLEMDTADVREALSGHAVLGLENRRDELTSTLPIGRVVGPEDVAALAVHLMVNTALTGATYDIDGGQQFI
jgi:NAD(P)-dependent dehydrogenase (short-subunit alcohol dehydrogenase family)